MLLLDWVDDSRAADADDLVQPMGQRLTFNGRDYCTLRVNSCCVCVPSLSQLREPAVW